MEMEHINENLIKVLIDTEDLAERGINFLDLIGDQSSIEKFFYSILEEVDVDQHFQESEAVTFQVMPSKDGLELYISRNNFEEMEAIFEDELTKRLLERKKKSRLQRDRSNIAKHDSGESQVKADAEGEHSRIIIDILSFDTLEAFLMGARQVKDFVGETSLYFMKDTYYLLIEEEVAVDLEAGNLKDPLWALLDYGNPARVTPEILAEHGELIRQGDALHFFAKNF